MKLSSGFLLVFIVCTNPRLGSSTHCCTKDCNLSCKLLRIGDRENEIVCSNPRRGDHTHCCDMNNTTIISTAMRATTKPRITTNYSILDMPMQVSLHNRLQSFVQQCVLLPSRGLLQTIPVTLGVNTPPLCTRINWPL
jgi:hypothetical protein